MERNSKSDELELIIWMQMISAFWDSGNEHMIFCDILIYSWVYVLRLRYLFKFLNVSLIQSVIKIKKKKVCFFFFFLPWHTACGILAPQSGVNLYPLYWKHEVLTNEPPGKSPSLFSIQAHFLSRWQREIVISPFFLCKIPGAGKHRPGCAPSAVWGRGKVSAPKCLPQ